MASWILRKLNNLGIFLLVFSAAFILIILGNLLEARPQSFLYEIFSDVLYGIGIAWVASAPLSFKLTDGAYWVYVVGGFVVIAL